MLIRPSVALRAGTPAPVRPDGFTSRPKNGAILRLLTLAVNAGCRKTPAAKRSVYVLFIGTHSVFVFQFNSQGTYTKILVMLYVV